MLTEKCPNCGSYNDPSAAECYFCKKDLPSTGKGKKKKKSAPQTTGETKTTLIKPEDRVNRPGCLMLYILILFFFIVAMAALMINAAGGYYVINLPGEYTYFAGFLSDAVAGPENADLNTLLTQVLPIFGIFLALTLALGLFMLQRWARALAMILQVLFSIAFIVYFYVLLTRYYNPSYITTEFVIVFVFTLIMILVNLYGAVWFFERSRIFGIHVRKD
jgi:hypothetical protein